MKTNKKSDWVKQFDNFAEGLCVYFSSDGEGDETNVYLDEILLSSYEDIKEFIRQQIKQAKQDVRQELKKKVEEAKNSEKLWLDKPTINFILTLLEEYERNN